METKLRLETIHTEKGTQILDQYFTSPLKIGLPKCYGRRKKIILMMASAGILKGDSFDYYLKIKKDSCALLTEQSYSKLFDMGEKGEAKKKVQIHLEKGASFYYKPCGTIPFQRSSFSCENFFYLDENSEFAFCDIFSSGRIAMGEEFLFRKYQSKSMVFINNIPVWMDHCCYEPGKESYRSMVHFASYSHQGSFYYYGSSEKMEHFLEFVGNQTYDVDKVYYGISRAKEGICIRALARSAQDLEEFFLDCANVLEME